VLATYEVLTTDMVTDGRETFAAEVAAGLSSSPKQLSSKWFYDARGSDLFERIIESPEYYLTGCESEILRRHRGHIAELAGDEPFRLIELGVGDGRKTRPLLQTLVERESEFTYVPVDICEATVSDLTNRLTIAFGPDFPVRGIVAEYMEAISKIDEAPSQRTVVLFLGSNIGNFNIGESVEFLSGLRRGLREGDHALIGFDLKKEISVLEAAYNDSAGLTAEFNFNLLTRMNRELDANFKRKHFVHHGRYNVRYSRMESWLVARHAHIVTIGALGRDVYFDPWEGIHVENSQKYDVADIEAIAEASGFEVVENLFDSRGYFCDSIWRAV